MSNASKLRGKKILLGVTGCIAAYKACNLVRDLIKAGAEVRVVLTPSALSFVTPLTLSTLSKNKVIVDVLPKSQGGDYEASPWHIEYGIWADIMLVAPASINTVAKITHGFADNALTTLVTALRSPLLVCPAADLDMYQYPVTQENLNTLRKRGVYILEAETGELASGLSGIGRFPENGKIIDAVYSILRGNNLDLSGKNVLVTAGPTYEDIDPVRYLGNRSSGKMGFEIAKAAYLRGASVTLISGPSNQSAYPEIRRINVRSAEQMKNTVELEMVNNDVLIMSAAVADFTPKAASTQKIKKGGTAPVIELDFTEDILSSLNKSGKFVIGFALETENEIDNAAKKLERKGLDLIVLNSLNEAGAGFENDTNAITILDKSGEKIRHNLSSKSEIAHLILDRIVVIN